MMEYWKNSTIPIFHRFNHQLKDKVFGDANPVIKAANYWGSSQGCLFK
jgi:hypothetical protein